MKTLKKVLAVVLALAMVLGMAVTASAGFKDAEKITYKEAVEVMSLAGVINGFPDGTFKPEGTLTRAQAAKMIVYALGLEDTSLGYKANFGDINGHWAETPISVAAGLGIVAGMGNGQFAPDATLTGFQWAKIILCAMGYDAEIEGLVGAGWEAKVAKLMKAVEMDEDLAKFDGSKPVSREVAAQMLFNVLDEGFVGYPEAAQKAVKLGSNYYSGKKAKFGEETNFADKLGLKSEATEDDFKRPGVEWFKNKGKKTEESVVVLDAPVASYTVATKQCDIFDELKLDKDDKFTLSENGGSFGAIEVKDVDKNLDCTKQGRLVEFYDVSDSNKDYSTYKVVAIDTYLAKVTKVVAAKYDKNEHQTAKAKITLTYFDKQTAKTLTLQSKKDYAYEKDDMVLVNVVDKETGVILGLAEVENAKITGKKVDNSAFTIGGESIAVAEKYTVEDGKTVTLNNKYDFYYDQYGNVIGAFESDSVEDYYVVDSAWEEVSGGKTTRYASIVGLDGEMKTVELNKKSNDGIATSTKAHDKSSMGLVNVVDKDDDTFAIDTNCENIKGSSDISSAYVEVKNGKETISGITADKDILAEDVQFLFQLDNYDDVANEDGKYVAYAGYEEVPSFKAPKASVWYVRNTDGEITAVYVDDAASILGETEYVYVKSTPEAGKTNAKVVEYLDSDTVVYSYEVYAGEEFKKTTVLVKFPNTVAGETAAKALFGGQGVYKIVKDSDGYVINATNEVRVEIQNQFKNKTLALNDGKYLPIYWDNKALKNTVVFYDQDLEVIANPKDYVTVEVVEDEDDDYYGKYVAGSWAYGSYADDDDFKVTAVILNFDAKEYNVTVNPTHEEEVKINGVAPTATLAYGTEFTVEVTEAAGYKTPSFNITIGDAAATAVNGKYTVTGDVVINASSIAKSNDNVVIKASETLADGVTVIDDTITVDVTNKSTYTEANLKADLVKNEAATWELVDDKTGTPADNLINYVGKDDLKLIVTAENGDKKEYKVIIYCGLNTVTNWTNTTTAPTAVGIYTGDLTTKMGAAGQPTNKQVVIVLPSSTQPGTKLTVKKLTGTPWADDYKETFIGSYGCIGWSTLASEAATNGSGLGEGYVFASGLYSVSVTDLVGGASFSGLFEVDASENVVAY